VANPSHPFEIGSYYTSGSARKIAVLEGYAYIADSYDGLEILDVSDPSVPTLAGFYNTLGIANGIAVRGNFAFVADWYYFGIYDCSAATGGPFLSENPRLLMSGKEDRTGSLSQPEKFTFFPTYPNPFNPLTTISFTLPKPSKVQVYVYDISGCLVAVLVNGWRETGMHEVVFDASNLASGIYVARINAGEFTAQQKLVYLK
jgi:hypothetical protein